VYESLTRYLILKKHDDAGGRAALVKLRGTTDVDEELEEIVMERQSAEVDHMGIIDLFRDGIHQILAYIPYMCQLIIFLVPGIIFMATVKFGHYLKVRFHYRAKCRV
jgi:hypothetical protein